MATYAIGDIQGCYDELRNALDSIKFDPSKDSLWFVGDLVNRGPKSLEALRFIKSLDKAAICVLGNHDLHLLAMAYGEKKHSKKDTLLDVLNAPDSEELLTWLRHQPLMHHDKKLGFNMIHAGLPPQWDIETALSCAHEVEKVLRGPDHKDYFVNMYGNEPDTWSKKLSGMERHRFITNCFTRLRMCTPEGQLRLKYKGIPGDECDQCTPWYKAAKRKTAKDKIIFGHWSTLGYVEENNVWALDTGCLWGGSLTLLRIDKKHPKPHHFNCPGQQSPEQFA